MKKRIAVIGSGFSGIAAAAYAAQAGNEVYVFEKNDTPGGRARQFTTGNGYTFDMGPSWYWMPDIIDDFFRDLGTSTAKYFDLVPLDPQFQMIFSDVPVSVPASYEELKVLFEDIEPGASTMLDRFMKSAGYKYEVGMKEFVQKPCHSWWEFISPKVALSALKLDLLSDFRSYVAKYFRHPKLRTLMEFPVIFLGASPDDIPALYSLMNYGGYGLGTWYPMGGFFELVKAMKSIAEEQGAVFHFNNEVERIITQHNKAVAVQIRGEAHFFDAIVASSDYSHTESLLAPKERNYGESYWKSRVFAPSCLIYYLGIKRKLPNLLHHTLFFENDLDQHIETIYGRKRWPEKPLFYVCCPSKTDPSVAPEGHENLFLLMPLATGVEDDEHTREQYLIEMIGRIEKLSGISNLAIEIDYKRSYCVSDFIRDYHACQGNAYGLANTLRQTAVLKPTIRNKKIKNLFYTGQLTVPGPGVPPSIISGKIVAGEVAKI